MKILKVLAIVLLALVGLWFVLAAVAPAELNIEESITIEASSATVFANVNCLDKWQAWSAWQAMDPEMKNEYSENPCGVGAWNSWDGPSSGKGTQTIEEVSGTEAIKMNLVFEGFEGVNYANWTFLETEGSTTVTWNFLGAPSPFMMRPMNLMMKGVLQDSYKKGLASLKDVAEAAPVETSYEISEVDLPEGMFLLISGDIEPVNIGEFYGNSFGAMMGYMAEVGAELNGHPTGFYYNWTDTLAKMAAAIPVNKEVAGNEDIEFRIVKGSKALQIDYYGAYDQSGAAHYAMDDYMAAQGLEVVGAVREIYVTDPMSEPDTSKWLTQIIYPVSPVE